MASAEVSVVEKKQSVREQGVKMLHISHSNAKYKGKITNSASYALGKNIELQAQSKNWLV